MRVAGQWLYVFIAQIYSLRIVKSLLIVTTPWRRLAGLAEVQRWLLGRDRLACRRRRVPTLFCRLFLRFTGWHVSPPINLVCDGESADSLSVELCLAGDYYAIKRPPEANYA
jgi:hypothetical protein